MNLVKINSINIWDEEWENGYYSYPDGTPAPSNDTIRAKNYIPAQPNTDYYIDSDGYNGYYVVVFYDTNKSVIGAVVGGSGSAFTTINNCAFVRFSAGNYGTTYNHDIQICLNSCTDKTTYHPHWVLGLDGQGKAFTADISSMLPSGIGVVDLGSLDYYIRANGAMISATTIDINLDYQYVQGVCSIYKCTSWARTNTTPPNNMEIGINADGNVNIVNTDYSDPITFKNAMNGVLLFYKKA